MGHFIDEITEVGEDRGGLNTTVAILVAVAASFVALCNVKDGNIVQAMQQAQANSVDAWSYYQAKSTKQNIAEGFIDQLSVQRDSQANLSNEARAVLERKIAEYTAKAKQYEAEKQKIKQSAEDFQKDYDRLNFRDDQFDMAEASLSLSIALLGITALTQRRWLLLVAVIFAAFGLALGVSGFMGYNIHPGFIAKLLS